jgi:hypothetical protein
MTIDAIPGRGRFRYVGMWLEWMAVRVPTPEQSRIASEAVDALRADLELADATERNGWLGTSTTANPPM